MADLEDEGGQFARRIEPRGETTVIADGQTTGAQDTRRLLIPGGGDVRSECKLATGPDVIPSVREKFQPTLIPRALSTGETA